MRTDAEDVTCIGVVAGQAILAAWEDPRLGAGRAVGARNEIILVGSGQQQVSVRIIAAPFVGDTVDAAGIVERQKTSFEPFELRRIGIVDGKREMFYENRALGELPTVCRRKDDLFGRGIVKTVIWNGQPALLCGAVGPERRIYGVRNQECSWARG